MRPAKPRNPPYRAEWRITRQFYDTDGNLIQTLDGTGSEASFWYDMGGRRTRIETKGKATGSYTYDAFRNITENNCSKANQNIRKI
ncbi:hypothetical protein CG710_014605 [Lachnotalea glycerini]|uniref:YD repeat-containing protein n=1 Tax=Lachnotalea glycerini TaxID=1763509 RepID=A0A371JCL9_9FIRM|nr:hypothetical protein CG710_014605 [Lachnotalea glycerini]